MDIKQKSINELKFLSAEIVSNAKSGHTGSAVGAATILFSLFHNHLMFNPDDPNFLNRDRLIMSAGHTSALYYSILHLFGYNISSEDLKNFRKVGSITPGHPEKGVTPGVEISTGPLGQGIANAVGLAIAESNLEAKLKIINPNLINNYTYCFCGDGCLMEGVAQEACSIAGTLQLNKLIILYDDNNITIDGTRELSNSENITKKFKAMNWNVISVKNGNDYAACSKAIKQAKKSQKPSLIIFKTIIGEGLEFEGTPKVHAYPLSNDELLKFKKSLDVNNSFGFSEDVYQFCKKTILKNTQKYLKWKTSLEYIKGDKTSYKIFKTSTTNQTINYNSILSKFKSTDTKTGRQLSSELLNLFSKYEPNLMGGAADVATSTLSLINNGLDFSATNRLGKNIHFGIREHAMGAICNGISIYNNMPSFCSTFLAFSNYMIPPLRMAAMMNTPVLSIFTHDSINIGQDGPTHQPIEQVGMLRSIPNLTTFRPASNLEMFAAFKYFFENKKPCSILASKNNLLNSNDLSLEYIEKGGYIISDSNAKPKVVIISTGDDVKLALEIKNILSDISVTVVSMPCEKLFDTQNGNYKNKVLPKDTLRVVIEASNDMVWHKYLSDNDVLINVTSYQKSGSGNEVYQNAGFDAEKIAKTIKKHLQ